MIMPSWLGLVIAGTYAALFASFAGVIAARLPVRVADASDRVRDDVANDGTNDDRAAVPEATADRSAGGPEASLAEPGSEWTTRSWAEAMGGRSRCDSCEAPIELWRNIPVVSWVVQRGKCAKCGAHIPVATIAIELVVPALVVVTLILGGWTWAAAGTCWLILIGAIVVQIDARTMMITTKVLAVGWFGSVLTCLLAVAYAAGGDRWGG